MSSFSKILNLVEANIAVQYSFSLREVVRNGDPAYSLNLTAENDPLFFFSVLLDQEGFAQ